MPAEEAPAEAKAEGDVKEEHPMNVDEKDDAADSVRGATEKKEGDAADSVGGAAEKEEGGAAGRASGAATPPQQPEQLPAETPRWERQPVDTRAQGCVDMMKSVRPQHFTARPRQSVSI